MDMKLAPLLQRAGFPADADWGDVAVFSVTSDSRRVMPGSLFVAVRGSHADGHDYIGEAAQKGCCAVVVENAAACDRHPALLFIAVEDSHAALGQLLAAFYNFPAEKLTMIGITGTNGKTTTAYLLEEMLRQAGFTPGVLGTVNYRFAGRLRPAPLTTPDPETLHRLLREMTDCGVTHVVMEVSSHSLEQKRLAGIRFDVGAFTNLSRDHLDYHHSMEAYYRSKLLLFTEHLKKKGTAVIALPWLESEDGFAEKAAWAARLKKDIAKNEKKTQIGRRILICGGGDAEVHSHRLQLDLTGIAAEFDTPRGPVQLHSPLVGSFNVDNLLTAAGIGCALNIDPEVIAKGLAAVQGVPGRLERVLTGKKIHIFVDYAHTPDALANVLSTLRAMGHGRLVAVFGCGGDRDRGKRPQMGLIAARRADAVIVTSDNPRSEAADKIIEEIVAGVQQAGLRHQRAELFLSAGWEGFFDVIADRRLAIRTAVRHCRPGDILLLAGKGHEDYQLIGGRKIHLDDRLEAAGSLNLWQ